MNKYNLILFSCVSESDIRPWASKPFIIDEVAYSTDASIMAIIPAALTNGLGEMEGYEHEKFLTVIPKLRLHKMHISVAELNHAIALYPMVPEEIECEACEGDGCVDYEFYFERSNYSKELECPVCKGEGSIKTVDNKVLDADKRIKIGESIFSFPYIQKITDAAKSLDVDNIELILQESARGKNIFRFDQVEMLLMPCIPDPDHEIIYEIKA